MNKITEEQWSEVIEQVRIMQAYVDGEEVQYLGYKNIWYAKTHPPFDFDSFKYRIKPAEPIPTYLAEG